MKNPIILLFSLATLSIFTMRSTEGFDIQGLIRRGAIASGIAVASGIGSYAWKKIMLPKEQDHTVTPSFMRKLAYHTGVMTIPCIIPAAITVSQFNSCDLSNQHKSALIGLLNLSMMVPIIFDGSISLVASCIGSYIGNQLAN